MAKSRLINTFRPITQYEQKCKTVGKSITRRKKDHVFSDRVARMDVRICSAGKYMVVFPGVFITMHVKHTFDEMMKLMAVNSKLTSPRCMICGILYISILGVPGQDNLCYFSAYVSENRFISCQYCGYETELRIDRFLE